MDTDAPPKPTAHPASDAIMGESQPSDDAQDGPSITHALEAMLGGLTPPPAAETPKEPEPTQIPKEAEDTDMANGHTEEVMTAGATESSAAVKPDPEVLGPAAMLDYQRPTSTTDANMENIEDGEPEFEEDSSPYESSSDDSSDSSSEDDSDEDNDFAMLSVEEQARILMEGDGGSDDEGGKGKGSGGQLRTKNEIPEEVIPKPDVTITPEMKIEELGSVEGIIENVVLIKAKVSGEYRVLESGSVLCLSDRSVIGAVSETIGRVEQPFYSVRFTNDAEIEAAGVAMSAKIFYSELHSTYVFTKTLKAIKGSDASNLHDEEVGDEEVEFSDDEKEMEHKRHLKQKKLEKKGLGGGIRGGLSARDGPGGRARPGRRDSQAPSDRHAQPSSTLNYDDDADEPYKPLARPAGFASSVSMTEAPQEGMGYQLRPPQSFSRGRGDRGRGRGGDRGRGDRERSGGGRGGYSKPHTTGAMGEQGHQQQQNRSPYSAPPPLDPRRAGNQNQSQQPGISAYAPPNPNPNIPANTNYNFPPAPSPVPNHSTQQFPQQPFMPQNFPNPYATPQQGWLQAPPQIPAGAFINPAFFAQQMAQQMGQAQQQGGFYGWPGYGQPQQPQQPGRNGGSGQNQNQNQN
jgi:H/ACA ribonucleoprotein complex non-core subunit NAF1